MPISLNVRDNSRGDRLRPGSLHNVSKLRPMGSSTLELLTIVLQSFNIHNICRASLAFTEYVVPPLVLGSGMAHD